MCDINQNFPSAPHQLHNRYSPIRNSTSTYLSPTTYGNLNLRLSDHHRL